MSQYQDLDPAFIDIYQRCKHATMTSVERMYALYKAVEYIVDADIPGAFVECGVWRGGSVMLMAATLLAKGISDRKIYLYDTFDGMAAPTENDRDLNNISATSQLEAATDRANDFIWCFAALDEVKSNLRQIGYPESNYVFVPGKVEESLVLTLPDDIALLRLDTDWYESTRAELEQLYPRLNRGGVLIIDDYGHWKGARQAVDEYFSSPGRPMLLNRIDYTGRIGVKG